MLGFLVFFFLAEELTVPCQMTIDPAVHLAFKDIAVDSMVETQSVRVVQRWIDSEKEHNSSSTEQKIKYSVLLQPYQHILLLGKVHGEGPLF